jgi:hypothetical protein
MWSFESKNIGVITFSPYELPSTVNLAPQTDTSTKREHATTLFTGTPHMRIMCRLTHFSPPFSLSFSFERMNIPKKKKKKKTIQKRKQIEASRHFSKLVSHFNFKQQGALEGGVNFLKSKNVVFTKEQSNIWGAHVSLWSTCNFEDFFH